MRLSQVHSYLLAFGFGNLAMLGWLAAAAAPILIHLWSRHRYREAPWAAMQFLLAAMQKNARRMQLQQWLLLAMRTLIIVLVVLAVAEPYGERLLAGGNAFPAHKILVIDGSYSMGYQNADRTNFANAKQVASHMVQQSNPADVFTVILMAAPAKVIASAELLDHVAVSRELESLVQAHTGADLASALALIKDALANTHVHNLPGRTEIYFLTDLQRCTWNAVAHEGAVNKNKYQSEVLDTFEAIAAGASVTMVDLGQSNSTNIAITSLSTSDHLITAGADIAFDATLHNFGAERGQLQAELLVDNVPVAEQRINIATDAEAQVRFRTRFNSTGSHAVTVRTSGDLLGIDNSRSLIVPVRNHTRVLCVAGREGAAKYVASALNPNPSGDSPIRPTIVAEGDLAETDLKDVDCVFLCNITRLSANERARLTQFVEHGGGLVTFLGDRVLPDSYNSLATRKTESESLLPASIGELVTQKQSGIDPLEYRHPIVASFRGRERSGLLTTPITHYYRLEVSKNRSGVAVAAAMRNGDPFIVTAKLGIGRTVLVATDASLSSVDPTTHEPWTTWPTWPSFLPIVREMMAYSVGGQQTQWELPVGKPLSGSLTNVGLGAAQRKLQILRPDGHMGPVSIDSIGSELLWTYADTDLAGIYTLRGESKDPVNQFAMNVDTSESDLAKVNATQLPDSVKVLNAWKGESTGTSATIASQAEWNQSLLWIVFGLLLIESLVAWQLGRGVR